MNSKDWLIINGSATTNDVGLYVDTPPMFAMAGRKYNKIDIPDKDESDYIEHEKYEDVPLEIKAYSFSNSFDIQSVYNLIRNARTISYNSKPTREFHIKKVNGITPNYSGHGKNLITLSFVASPFRYFTANTPQTFSTGAFTVNNTGNFYSKPNYKVVGDGDITIKVTTTDGEEQELTVYDVDEYCYINTERQVVHKNGDFLHTEGVLPLLDVGNNSFEITGDGYTSIEITVNARDV